MQAADSIPNGKIDEESRKQDGADNASLSGFLSEDEALAYLAKVLVDAYFEQRKYEKELTKSN